MRIYYKCGFCSYEFYFYSSSEDYNSDYPSSMIIIHSLGGVVNNNKRKGKNKIKKQLLYPDPNLVIGVCTVTCFFLSEEERNSFLILNENEIEIMLKTYKIWSNNEYSNGMFTRVFWK